ncbi:MAG: hypothetical protein A3C47_01600 [Omnitrophica bacterium RIFCSPHIGHO2_02_FULL_51_18]|nr:MAG: hypothetical protein A3C47_01600 [Omnitrophica bacterium RIFCSPHIGHO2_02_FULL_51_18]
MIATVIMAPTEKNITSAVRPFPDVFQTKLPFEERVTVVLYPLDRYSTLPETIDSLHPVTTYPFELLVVEGSAPDSVRSALEKRKSLYKNIRIIYSDQVASVSQSMNLAIPHIRTPYAFFTNNRVRFAAGWLNNLMRCIKETRADMVCPIMEPAELDPSKPFTPVNINGILIKKDALKKIGEIDSKISTPLLGLDMSFRAKELRLSVIFDSGTRLKLSSESSIRPMDIKLYEHQWDWSRNGESFAYIQQKWGAKLDKKAFIAFLEGKKALLKHPTVRVRNIKDRLQSRLYFASINVKRLAHIFVSL